jgi:hypothetical protein
MEIGAPAWILFQVICHMLGEKNVTGVPAIHHALRHVNASAGNVGLFVQITDFIDRAAVNAHPHVKFGMTLQRLANFHCAQHRRFGASAENKCATIASR